MRDELRAYWGAQLHRRLFAWFGVAIFLTVASTGLLHHFLATRELPRPWRGILFFAVPACVVWLITGKIARRVARPLYEVVRVSRELGAGRFTCRVDLGCVGGSSEAAFVGRAMNDMARRIEQQMADQRELLAAVSHELRTPLARLRVLTELVRTRDGDPQPITPLVDEIEREVVEIDALVGELLASARLDFQALTTKPVRPIDAAKRALARAGLTEAAMVVAGEPDEIKADPTLLGRALANLLDNARKHGGGVDRLRVRALERGGVAFEVEDRGRGFSAGEEARAFAAFYQGPAQGPSDKPEDPDERPPGLGLGLALVQRIAKAHGGAVRAENRDGGGARVAIELPAEPPLRPTSQEPELHEPHTAQASTRREPLTTP